jgi:Fe2+ transport system protein FeoA
LAALLALAASLSWGVGDFLGGVKARVLPSLLVMAASQPFGLAALGIAVAVRGTGIPGDEVAWAALSAVLGTIGLFAFYRGMAAGAISVVAPLAALSAGDRATIVRLAEHDGDLLHWFYENGLAPGTEIELKAAEPATGQYRIGVGGGEQAISEKAAAGLYVRAA